MTRREIHSVCSHGRCVPEWHCKPPGAAWIHKSLEKLENVDVWEHLQKSVTPRRPWSQLHSSETNFPGLLAVTSGSAPKSCATQIGQTSKRPFGWRALFYFYDANRTSVFSSSVSLNSPWRKEYYSSRCLLYESVSGTCCLDRWIRNKKLYKASRTKLKLNEQNSRKKHMLGCQPYSCGLVCHVLIFII